ncbi:MAG: CHASE2 domain-containing protein [Leptolyngbyaceae cyanobacterium bins.349]|nr:CHASE2 domain-containing protein [Leptolyngbyaceae cyanobacterium bins.349]
MALSPLKNVRNYFFWFSIQGFLIKVGVPVFVTSLTLTGAVLGLRHFGLLQGLELAAYDHFVQSQPDRGPDDRLLIVGIDEIDLQMLQEWPISDRTLAILIQRLQSYQPRVIGIDVLRDIPIEPGRAELLTALQSTQNVIAVCKVNSKREFGAAPPPDIALENVGSADLVIDPGGILRRTLFWLTPPDAGLVIKKHLCNDPNHSLLSFSFNAALLYLQPLQIKPELTATGELKLGTVVFSKFQAHLGGYRNADAGGYQVMLRYRSRDNAAPQVRLTDVLNGQVAPDLIRDRIVLIGYTTPQAKDDFYTPYSASQSDAQKMPGVLVHAQSVSQILSAVLDGEPLVWVWSPLMEVLWLLGWSLVGGILAWHVRHPFWFSIVVISASTTIYLVSLLVFLQGGWIPSVPAIATFMGTAVGIVLLDRFNNSSYGQTMYKTVKTLLHLDVEIDEQKVEQQVLEITETDYFRDLQDTVKSLREQNSSAGVSSNTRLDASRVISPSLPPDSTATDEAQSFNPMHNSDNQSAEDYELDLLQLLQQEGKLSRLESALTPECDRDSAMMQVLHPSDQQRSEYPLATSSEPVAPHRSTYQPFSLDDSCSQISEVPDDDLTYWQDLKQESQKLREPKAENKNL